ncbi:unnamed protein product [Ophioblennius macclurei]
MSDLEDISHHIQDRISSLKCLLDLSLLDSPQVKMEKLGEELCALERHLERFESCVEKKEEQLKDLKELEQLSQRYLEDVEHMKDNVPSHMPQKNSSASGNEPVTKRNEADVRPALAENGKKCFIKEMEVITMQEFNSIPQYMKGRVSYDQVNTAVQSINTAVTFKYKIVHQPEKTLNNQSRRLRQRFKDQETKDTKGHYFIVEDDIREFAQIKVDKRFQGILNMLRHCQRLRELRGGGVTRFVLL